MKLPAIQFYPGDWRKDPGVQSLSYHDRGVWFEILCLMHESPQRGKLLLNGKKMSVDALARLLGLDQQTLDQTLARLEDAGVYSMDPVTGALMSRRMVRDEELRQVRARSGRLGGNPGLLLKQKTTTPLNQNPTPSSSASSSTASSEGETHPRAHGSEIPTGTEAIAQTVAAGIPPDFARYVHADWSSRSGRDGAGNLVPWLPYVTKRWAREQTEWKAGTHRGRKSVGTARPPGCPAQREVEAYAREKWGDDPRHENWAVSFYRHWNDPRRAWARQGIIIDWKDELTRQTAKWRSQ